MNLMTAPRIRDHDHCVPARRQIRPIPRRHFFFPYFNSQKGGYEHVFLLPCLCCQGGMAKGKEDDGLYVFQHRPMRCRLYHRSPLLRFIHRLRYTSCYLSICLLNMGPSVLVRRMTRSSHFSTSIPRRSGWRIASVHCVEVEQLASITRIGLNKLPYGPYLGLSDDIHTAYLCLVFFKTIQICCPLISLDGVGQRHII